MLDFPCWAPLISGPGPTFLCPCWNDLTACFSSIIFYCIYIITQKMKAESSSLLTEYSPERNVQQKKKRGNSFFSVTVWSLPKIFYFSLKLWLMLEQRAIQHSQRLLSSLHLFLCFVLKVLQWSLQSRHYINLFLSHLSLPVKKHFFSHLVFLLPENNLSPL